MPLSTVLSPLGFALLRQLADGELHSGEALAAATGITRARVSQILSAAEAAGFTLERMRGVGYRLIDPIPFLDRDAIVAALGAPTRRLKIEVIDSVDSTSSELLRRAARRDMDRQVLAAEWQTACASMLAAGFKQVSSFNPYWERRGRTYEDLDGYRIVLQQAEWSNVEKP